MRKLYSYIELTLQQELTRGWQDFLKSKHFQPYKDFALFLDSLDDFQKIHRDVAPHPPHEFAARYIGLPLMNKLMSWGIFTSFWFPGDYYESKEIDYEADTDEDVHARVFTLDLLVDNGKKKLCELTFTFPHLHDGFGFLEPIVKISKQYISDMNEAKQFLSEELLHAANSS